MSCQLSTADMDRLFPAYLQVAPDGTILNAGHSIQKHADHGLLNRPLLEVFDVQRPLADVGISGVLKSGGNCVLSLSANPSIRLQGSVHESSGMFFLLLGYVAAMDDRLALTFSDFAPFDGSKDLIVATQIRKGLLSDVEDLVLQLKAEKQIAESANRSKSEFLACMSHEIRTPLNGVLGLAALLERTDLTDVQVNMLQSLRDCGTSLLDLLNDIIDISRMDAERFEIVEEPISISEVAERITDQYAIIADGKDIRLQVDVHPNLRDVVVHCDPGRLFQIISNLVSNAIKFTHQGEVQISIHDAATTDPHQTCICIQVSDTGIGISNENLEQIFQPFKQADAGITRTFGGTGLGLSICKRLCEMMGGSVEVKSALGEGSTFSVVLPLRRVQQRLAM